MKDAFGVHKAHHHHYTFKRIVKELTSQGASTTYDQSKRKRRVSKADPKMAIKYVVKKPAYKTMDKYYAAKNKVHPKKKDMDNWGDINKVVIRTPTRLVRMMSDKVPREGARFSNLLDDMSKPDSFFRPVEVVPQRKFNLTPSGADKRKALGLKEKTRLPLPKLVNGHHRLQVAEHLGRKTIPVRYALKMNRLPPREPPTYDSEGRMIWKKPH